VGSGNTPLLDIGTAAFRPLAVGARCSREARRRPISSPVSEPDLGRRVEPVEADAARGAQFAR